MVNLSVTSAGIQSTAPTVALVAFVLFILTYAAYLIWAIYHREDEVDRQIRDAIAYPETQAKTAAALKGETK